MHVYGGFTTCVCLHVRMKQCYGKPGLALFLTNVFCLKKKKKKLKLSGHHTKVTSSKSPSVS